VPPVAYGAAATDTACKAVEKYLDKQSATQTKLPDALMDERR